MWSLHNLLDVMLLEWQNYYMFDPMKPADFMYHTGLEDQEEFWCYKETAIMLVFTYRLWFTLTFSHFYLCVCVCVSVCVCLCVRAISQKRLDRPS